VAGDGRRAASKGPRGPAKASRGNGRALDARPADTYAPRRGGALTPLFGWSLPASISGASPIAFAAAAAGIGLLIFLVSNVNLPGALRTLISAAFWAALIGGLWLGYDHRDELFDLAQRALDSGAEPSVGKSGEVTFRRSLGGEFVVAARVDDRPVKFVFDTGASTVVLTAEDARRIGLDEARLDFSAEVFTANGAAMAAPTRLARLAVGPIVVRNVRALVTRPGAMQESLLGMSFLDQLQSYSVERGRLTLKGR
jgi:aspartyl protease family protein